MWKGKNAIFLDEYFKDKCELQKLKRLPERLYIGGETEKIIALENKIKEFVCTLNSSELKSLIYMSLDIEYKGD